MHDICCENGVANLKAVLSSDHVYRFKSVPAKLAIIDLVRRTKGTGPAKCNESFPSDAGVRAKVGGQGHFSTA